MKRWQVCARKAHGENTAIPRMLVSHTSRAYGGGVGEGFGQRWQADEGKGHTCVPLHKTQQKS